jgi:hypothetical protein
MALSAACLDEEDGRKGEVRVRVDDDFSRTLSPIAERGVGGPLHFAARVLLSCASPFMLTPMAQKARHAPSVEAFHFPTPPCSRGDPFLFTEFLTLVFRIAGDALTARSPPAGPAAR